MMDTKRIFSHRLKELRKKKNYTQRDLVDKAAVSYQAISTYERDEDPSMPAGDVLAHLAQALDTSADYLLGLTDAETCDSDFQKTVIELLPCFKEDVLKVGKAYKLKYRTFEAVRQSHDLDEETDYLTNIYKALSIGIDSLFIRLEKGRRYAIFKIVYNNQERYLKVPASCVANNDIEIINL